MKNTFKITAVIAFFLTFLACQNEDFSFGSLDAPTNINIAFEIQGQDEENPDGDGSGIVLFTTTATNAISYKYIFSDGTSQVSPSGIYQKRFSQNGTNTYEVTVLANGRGGVMSSETITVTVFSDFSDDEAVMFLTGGNTKKWYWAANEPGHLGVGPNTNDAANNFWPVWYAATPFEKAGNGESDCLYENEITFKLEGGMLKMEHDNGGRTYFNVAFQSVVGGTLGFDYCYDYDTSGEKTVSLAPSNSFVAQNGVPGQTRGTLMEFSDNGFLGYYIGQNTYEILSLTENRMVVRAVAGNDSGLAWYHILTTTPYDQQGGGANDDFTNLIWADEFDVDGPPNPDNWGYDIGTGNNGWGNAESQYYTNNANNVIVQDGKLIITARAENFSGSNYTSARIKSENKFDFQYGKIEVRAKLPSGGGTWPAIWLLGANFSEVGWPQCGEIDIMEHVGNQQDVIHGALHYPGNSAGNANTNSINIPNVSNEFHTYSVIWTENSIRFFVDDQQFHTFANSGSVPFNHDFFIILNVAMGGSFGGAIDPNFTQSSMEIEYVRVYQ